MPTIKYCKDVIPPVSLYHFSSWCCLVWMFLSDLWTPTFFSKNFYFLQSTWGSVLPTSNCTSASQVRNKSCIFSPSPILKYSYMKPWSIDGLGTTITVRVHVRSCAWVWKCMTLCGWFRQAVSRCVILTFCLIISPLMFHTPINSPFSTACYLVRHPIQV